MRVQLVIDSATTRQVRALLAAASRTNMPYPRVKCDGPEHWGIITDALKPAEADYLLTIIGGEEEN